MHVMFMSCNKRLLTCSSCILQVSLTVCPGLASRLAWLLGLILYLSSTIGRPSSRGRLTAAKPPSSMNRFRRLKIIWSLQHRPQSGNCACSQATFNSNRTQGRLGPTHANVYHVTSKRHILAWDWTQWHWYTGTKQNENNDAISWQK